MNGGIVSSIFLTVPMPGFNSASSCTATVFGYLPR